MKSLVQIIVLAWLAPHLHSFAEENVGWTAAQNAGLKALNQNDLDGAEQQFTAALKLAEKIGPKDVRIAQSCTQLGIISNLRGKYPAAETFEARAVGVFLETLAADDAQMAMPLSQLALAQLRQSKIEQAETAAQRGMGILERTKPQSVQFSDSAALLAEIRGERGNYNEAEALFRRAIVTRSKLIGDDHWEVAALHFRLGKLNMKFKQYEQAQIRFDLAVQIYEKQTTKNDPRLIAALIDGAAAYEELASDRFSSRQKSNLESAEAQIRKAIQYIEGARGKESLDLLPNVIELAQFYQRRKTSGALAIQLARASALAELPNGSPNSTYVLSLGKLAECYRVEGKFEKAEPLFKKTLGLLDNSGISSKDSLIIKENHSALLRQTGRAPASQPAVGEAATPATPLRAARWRMQFNAGMESVKSSDFEKAATQFSQALIEAEGFGPKDERIYATLQKLAEVYSKIPNYGNKLNAIYIRMLSIRESQFGKDAVENLDALKLLAGLYSSNRFDESEQLYTRALQLQERLTGPDSLDVAVILNDMAMIAWNQSRNPDAEARYSRAFEIDKKNLALGLPDRGCDADRYAQLLRKQKKPDLATEIEMHTEKMNAQAAAAKRWHDVFLRGKRAFNAGDMNAAIKELDRALMSVAETAPRGHAMLATLELQARATDAQSQLEKADGCLGALVSLRDGPAGRKPAVEWALDLAAQAQLRSLRGRPGEAADIYQRALTVLEQLSVTDDAQLFSLSMNLATTSELQGKFVQSAEWLRKAMVIKARNSGPDSAELQPLMEKLSTIYLKLKDYPSAMECFQWLRAAYIRTDGPASVRAALILARMAEDLVNQNRVDDAIRRYKEVHAVLEKQLGRDHPQTLRTLQQLGVLYLKQQRLPEAEEALRGVLADQERQSEIGDPCTADVQSSLGKVFAAQGKREASANAFRGALMARERAVGPMHPDLSVDLLNFAAALKALGQNAEADKVLAREQLLKENKK